MKWKVETKRHVHSFKMYNITHKKIKCQHEEENAHKDEYIIIHPRRIIIDIHKKMNSRQNQTLN